MADLLKNKHKIKRSESVKALGIMDMLRELRVFDAGRKSFEILKEWRQKRR